MSELAANVEFNPFTKDIELYAYVGNKKYHIDTLTKGGKPEDDRRRQFKHRSEIHESTTTIKGSRRSFEFDVQKISNSLLHKFVRVDPLTGNVEASDMSSMLLTPSIVHDGHAISYGFHDAGAFRAHRCYVYVTNSYESWMGDLLSSHGDVRNVPFHVFALPGSHDAGMYELGMNEDDFLRLVKDALSRSEAFKALVKDAMANEKFAALVKDGGWQVFSRVAINLAVTQKDTIAVQLQLGARYFDFRPGYDYWDAERAGKLRHQHGFIPGCTLASFLEQVKGFLMSHPNEIVVTSFKTEMASSTMIPGPGVLSTAIQDVFAPTEIFPGEFQDMYKPYGKLLAERKRFIVVDAGAGEFASTYEKRVHATTDPRTIAAHLDKLVSGREIGDRPYTVQLQGTPSELKEEIARTVSSSSEASSPLLYSKPRFDWTLYPWIARNHRAFSNAHPIVFLNDFVDNCLAERCVRITRERYDAYKQNVKPATKLQILFVAKENDKPRLFRCDENGVGRELITDEDISYEHRYFAVKGDICCRLRPVSIDQYQDPKGRSTRYDLIVYSIQGKRGEVTFTDVMKEGAVIHGTNVFFARDNKIEGGKHDGIYVFDTTDPSNEPAKIVHWGEVRRLTVYQESADRAARLYFIAPDPPPCPSQSATFLHSCDLDGGNHQREPLYVEERFVLREGWIYFMESYYICRWWLGGGSAVEKIKQVGAFKGWAGLPPGFFVSPDQEVMAFNDKEGTLFRFSFRSGDVTEIINRFPESVRCVTIAFLSNTHVFYYLPMERGNPLVMCDFDGGRLVEGSRRLGVFAQNPVIFDGRIYANRTDVTPWHIAQADVPQGVVDPIGLQSMFPGNLVGVTEVPAVPEL